MRRLLGAQLMVAHRRPTCYRWLHIEKEETWITSYALKGRHPARWYPGRRHSRPRASQPPRTSGRRWRAFALLVAAMGMRASRKGLHHFEPATRRLEARQ